MAIRPDLISALTTRLGTIKTTNTNPVTGEAFNTDIGNNVTYGSMTEPLPNQTPGVNYMLTQEVYFLPYGKNARQATIQVEAFQIDRENNVTAIANQMLDDIDSVLLHDSADLTMRISGTVLEIRFSRYNPFTLEGRPPLAGLVAQYNIVYEP